MATQTTDQQNALKDAMARAKQIAAKLQQQNPAGESPDGEENRKRGFNEISHPGLQPVTKRNLMDGVDHTDPKVIAQQVANSLVQRSSIGPMLVEEITIPNKLVGLVIGRGGEMINKLQSESGAKVQVAPDPPPNMADMVEDRQITITGTADAVSKAKSLISEIQNSGKVPERLMIGTLPGEFSIEMNISRVKVGLVIGKGGETIKNLQERAGCKMVLFQDGEHANAPEKPLRISGEQSTVMYGKQLVQDLLTSKELEGMNSDMQHQDGQNYKEIDIPREAVGLIIGAKGANIHQIQMETGCRVRFKNEMEGPTKTAMLNGNPQQLAAAEAKLSEIVSMGAQGQRIQLNGTAGPRPAWSDDTGAQHPGGQGGGPGGQGGSPGGQGGGPGGQGGGPGGQGGGPGGQGGGPGGQGGGPGGEGGGPGGQGGGPGGPGGPQSWGQSGPRTMGSRNSNLQPGHKDMIVEVPANKCGLVIGKGGETIKFIKNETKVNIELNRDVPDTSIFRIFRVQGTDEMIEKALVIMREKINDTSLTAKPANESEQNPGQNQWGGQSQQNQQWNQQQQWPGQQQQQHQQQQRQQQQQQQQQQSGWGQQQQHQGSWNQQSQPPQDGPGWNQSQSTPQQTWDPQQQQWQQQNAASQGGQWSNQQQWNQSGQQGPNNAQQNQQASIHQQRQGQNGPNSGGNSEASQGGAQQTSGQPDYSAAWALYYQQQQQYYQQYALQQQTGAVSTAPGSASAASTPSTAPTQTTANNHQAQAMAEYQAKLAEYYKQFGQQAPQ